MSVVETTGENLLGGLTASADTAPRWAARKDNVVGAVFFTLAGVQLIWLGVVAYAAFRFV